jgi:HEAT repeat protein
MAVALPLSPAATILPRLPTAAGNEKIINRRRINLPHRQDKFKRWMIASFFLIPLVLFGPIVAYYAYLPIKMHILIHLLLYDYTQEWAAEKIYEHGKKAVPYVIKGLWSENEEIRLCSEFILEDLASEGIRDETIVPRLIKLLSHPNARVRAGAATGLSILPDESAAPELVQLLSDPDPNARASAAHALGHIKQKEALPHLIRLLSDSDGEVRMSAAYALGNIGDKRAVPALIKLLSECNIFVRMSAIFALGEIGAEQAVGPLITCLSPKARWGMALPEYEPAVIESLEKITGENFGSVWRNTPRPILQETIQKWLQWWEENKEKYEAAGEGTIKEENTNFTK